MDIDLNIPWEDERNDSSSEEVVIVNDDVVNDDVVNDDIVNDDVVNNDIVNDDDLDDCPPIVEGGWVQRVGTMLNTGGNADNMEVNPITTGMTFVNGDECAAYCYLYAYKNSFQIFIRCTELMKKYQNKGIKRNGTGNKRTRFYMMKRIRFCCTWGAEPSQKNGFKEIPNFEKCKFAVEASLRNDLVVIGACSLLHNHKLEPQNTRHMVSYRMFDEYFKRRALLNDAAGISISQNFHILVREAGGYENLRIELRDVRNLLNLERRRSRINGDAAALEERFIKLREVDPEFYYAIEKDAEGKLLNVFWADGRCRGMAKTFGRVLSYDATFCVNREIVMERKAHARDLLETRMFIRELLDILETKKEIKDKKEIDDLIARIRCKNIEYIYEEEFNLKYSASLPEDNLKWRQVGNREYLPMPMVDDVIVRLEGEDNNGAPSTPPPTNAEWRQRGRYALVGNKIRRLQF